MKQQEKQSCPQPGALQSKIQAYVSRFNLVRECFTGNTLQMSCGALTIMQYKMRRRNMLNFHLSCTRAHTQTLFHQKELFHVLSIWFGSVFCKCSGCQSGVCCPATFSDQWPLSVFNSLISPGSNPAMYTSVSLDCT